MKLDLDGRRFVVCGASRGLGRATAEELVANGARVVVVSRNPQAAAEAIGEAAVPVSADLADPAGIGRVRAAVADAFGDRLDGVLVNSGGPPQGGALDLDDDAWRAAFELLVLGPIRLLRELVPLMPGGSVVFVTSSSVRQPIDGLDSSNVLRPGVAALAKVLARELAPGIRVNSLAPGRFDTDRVRELDAGRAAAQHVDVDAVRERQAAGIPLRRYGDPRELARVAAFLLSDAASYVSGASIQVDGGAITALP